MVKQLISLKIVIDMLNKEILLLSNDQAAHENQLHSTSSTASQHLTQEQS
jgi:hypothetical protein